MERIPLLLNDACQQAMLQMYVLEVDQLRVKRLHRYWVMPRRRGQWRKLGCIVLQILAWLWRICCRIHCSVRALESMVRQQRFE